MWLEARHKRLGCGEAPPVVRLQHPVDERGQPRRNPHCVGRAGLEPRGEEAVERGVQPLTPPRDRRVELQHRRPRALLENRERRHRPAELHQDRRVRPHLDVTVPRGHVDHPQRALRLEGVDVVLREPHSFAGDDYAVLLPSLPPRIVGLEEQRAPVEPDERSFDRWLDRHELRCVHRLGCLAERHRQPCESRHLLPSRRDRYDRSWGGDGDGDVAETEVPVAAASVPDREAPPRLGVPVAIDRPGIDKDAVRIPHVLPHAHHNVVDGDIAELVGPGCVCAVVQQQADRPQRAVAATLAAGADVDPPGVAHALPDPHVDIDRVTAGRGLGLGLPGNGDHGHREHQCSHDHPCQTGSTFH